MRTAALLALALGRVHARDPEAAAEPAVAPAASG